MNEDVKNMVNRLAMHPVAAMRNGAKFYHRAQMGEEIFYRQEYLWLARQLRPGTVVLDIGANIGDTTVYFAQFNEVKRVVAYEPVPYLYGMLTEVVGRSGLGGKITTRNLAISDARGYLSVPDRTAGTGFSIRGNAAGAGKRVRKITLADALKGLRNVAIKCDCEGEEQYLFGNADLRNVYAVMLEWHGAEAREAAAKALRMHGFDVRVENKWQGGAGSQSGYMHAAKAGRRPGKRTM